MKKIYLLISFLFVISFVKAQNGQPGNRQQNIEALKVAFISKELNLTPQEAEKFWPVYNQYSQETKAIYKSYHDNPDVIGRDEKILNVRKSYKERFIAIIGADRTNKLFDAENRFRELLIKQLRNRKADGNQHFLRQSLRRS
ncbi:hypothetical protein [Ferruginibacter albus]|uniref:hypothetical protein n=1 Tax=Ferruginibacter albus TaxID=2875540 RepID=UPI001CC370BB|nr:hypothetical protein [Ferruginibacter albus]UAY52355.1 hypothetical protein K9M53_01360 [Ferruginibacter albus]